MTIPTWQDIASRIQNHRAGTIAQIQPRIPDLPHELPLSITKIPRELLSLARSRLQSQLQKI